MEDNRIVTNAGAVIADKKMGNYQWDDNFVGQNELTVTITLAEYRDLVQKSMKAERDAKDSENWKLKVEIDGLKKKIECLTCMLKGEKEEDDEM